MKILFLFAVCLCFFFSFPTKCIALPVHYTATGSAIDNDGSTLSISGWMDFDDQIRHWNSGQTVQANEYISTGSYGYYITEFSLRVGNNVFFGTSGALYFELHREYPTLDAGIIGDLQWTLDGLGAWTSWHHQLFYFFNADGSTQDSYLNLASLIHLPHTADSYPELFSPEMWLSRQDPALVPEPSTLVLVGASLFGLLVFRRFRS